MQETERLPLQTKRIEILVNNVPKRVPAFHKNWISPDRHFSKYVSHPIPENGKFVLGEKETWLELAKYVQEDLRWLLRLRHHKFWSYIYYCDGAQELVISFLQEAPPYYMRNLFPKDKEMQDALVEIEHLVLLVLLRLSTQIETRNNYIADFGEFLYDRFVFTVPILLDICLVLGVNYRETVVKIVQNVLVAEPRFLEDFKEVPPHIVEVFNVVKCKLQLDNGDGPAKLSERRDLHSSEIRDLVLHYYDSLATLQIFLDIYPNGCALFLENEFVSEVANFYSTVIPKLHSEIKRCNNDMLASWKILDFVDYSRIDALKIVKHIVTYILNEAVEDSNKRPQLIDYYLILMSEVLSEPIFLIDYHNLYSVDLEIDLVTQIYPDVDTVKTNFILEGITSCIDLPELAKETVKNKIACRFEAEDYEPEGACAASSQVSGVELESLISEVKDILPHLGEGFIQQCLDYYNFETEKVIAAVLENNLPSALEKLDQSLSRNAVPKHKVLPAPINEVSSEVDEDILDDIYMRSGYRGKREKYKNLNQMLDDKTEISGMRDRYSQLAIIDDNDYEDEYDDTYDSNDVTVRESYEVERVRRPLVTPRVLRVNEESEEESEEEEVNDVRENDKSRDHFVQNPAELRERYERQRAEKMKRDLVGRAKGQGQDKQVLANRDFKGTNKSFTANHNRRKQASRKRNQGMIPS